MRFLILCILLGLVVALRAPEPTSYTAADLTPTSQGFDAYGREVFAARVAYIPLDGSGR